jgi:hypothetical protein
MAGALRKLTALPLIPLIADGKVFTVEESDLMAAIVVIAAADRLTDSTISVAHSTPVLLRDLMIALAEEEGRRPRFLKIPWRPTYFCLRAAEYLGIRLPFRADSLLGLVRPASSPPNDGALRYLGVTPRSFPATTSPRLAR